MNPDVLLPKMGESPPAERSGAGESPPLPSASLELPETNPQCREHWELGLQRYGSGEYDLPPLAPLEGAFRHSGWQPLRILVHRALARCGQRSRSEEAFCTCGSRLYAEVTASGDEVRLTSNTCHSRWCIPCQQQRAAIVAANLRDRLRPGEDRFLTLTLRHSDTPLSAQINRLYRSFSALRRSTAWAEHVTGGAAFCEVKVSDRDGLWHVHLHCVVSGSFWHQREISAAWHGVTGDSSIVDVRLIRDNRDLAGYLTKYLSKPTDASTYHQPEKLLECILALRGRHACMTFGTWRKLKLCHAPPDTRAWQPWGQLTEIVARAHAGCQVSVDRLLALSRKYRSVAQWIPFEARPPD